MNSNDDTPDAAARGRMVRQLLRMGLSEVEIGERLGTTIELVRGDILAVRKELGERLSADFNSAREVGEARDQYSILIAVLMRELQTLVAIHGVPAAAKVRCAAGVADLIDRRLMLAARVGLLRDVQPASTGTVLSAATIRERLERIESLRRIPDSAYVSVGEREWLAMDREASSTGEEPKEEK